jgi:hypothetical protein
MISWLKILEKWEMWFLVLLERDLDEQDLMEFYFW